MYTVNKYVPRIFYLCRQNYGLVEFISCADIQMCCYTKNFPLRQDLLVLHDKLVHLAKVTAIQNKLLQNLLWFSSVT